jgi:hypothetical protein
MKGIFLMAQDQATGDRIGQQIGQQVRQQIDAARAEAQAAAKASRAGGGPPVAIPFNPNQGPSQSVVELTGLFFVMTAAVLIFWPLTRAIARRINSGNVTQRVPAELSSQLTQLTQAVDAIAVEVERISEGQRFTTRLLSAQRDPRSGTILSAVAGSDTPPANPG